MPARLAPFVVLAAPLAVLILVLVRRIDPKWFLAALVLSTFLGWFQFSTSIGRVNLRLTDIPYLMLVGSLLFVGDRTRRAEGRCRAAPTRRAPPRVRSLTDSAPRGRCPRIL